MAEGTAGVRKRSSAPGDYALAAQQAETVEDIRRVTRSVQAVLAHLAAQAGLSSNDFQALVRVVAADGLTGAELRQILGVTSSSISELADRLECSGMIERSSRAPSDRRLIVLKPTALGRQAVERALTPVLAAMASVVDGFSQPELIVVRRFLGEVEGTLDELASG